MFAYKKKYFLIIKSIKDINLNKIKKNHKFFIIYRNDKNREKLQDLLKFRKLCKTKGFKFLVANNVKLNITLKTDGIYLSSYNKSFKPLFLKNIRKIIIGSAHNNQEIALKRMQGCKYIVVSKLFKVDYNPRSRFLDIIKFNNLILNNKNIVPLGGIKINSLNKLRIVRSDGFAIMSEIKKKPAISSRLF